MTDPIVDSVRTKLAKRSAAGVAKYGTDMTRTDLSRVQWLRHAQEEALDLAVYLERLIQEETAEKSRSSDDAEDDPLYGSALEIVATTGNAGAAHLERMLKCGYNRSERLLERMEVAGVVSIRSPVNGRRIVLRGPKQPPPWGAPAEDVP